MSFFEWHVTGIHVSNLFKWSILIAYYCILLFQRCVHHCMYPSRYTEKLKFYMTIFHLILSTWVYLYFYSICFTGPCPFSNPRYSLPLQPFNRQRAYPIKSDFMCRYLCCIIMIFVLWLRNFDEFILFLYFNTLTQLLSGWNREIFNIW